VPITVFWVVIAPSRWEIPFVAAQFDRFRARSGVSVLNLTTVRPWSTWETVSCRKNVSTAS